MLKIDAEPANIEQTKNITNLEKFNFNNIFKFLKGIGVNLVNTNQEFKDIISFDTLTEDMILIVSTNKVNKTHEGHLLDNPVRDKYAMLSILIPWSPYLLFLFSSTNHNLWLGTWIIKHDWGVVTDTDQWKTFWYVHERQHVPENEPNQGQR